MKAGVYWSGGRSGGFVRGGWVAAGCFVAQFLHQTFDFKAFSDSQETLKVVMLDVDFASVHIFEQCPHVTRSHVLKHHDGVVGSAGVNEERLEV